MTLEQAAGKALSALEVAGVPHMLVGGLTSNFYGIPRATQDVDIVIQLTDLKQLSAVATALGDGFSLDPQTSFETITGNIRHVIRLRGSPFIVELFLLGDNPFQMERFRRRSSVFIPQFGQLASLPTAEDVVVQKIRWGRPRDLEDAKDVLAVQGHALDREYIERWCVRHGTLDRLNAVRAQVPPI